MHGTRLPCSDVSVLEGSHRPFSGKKRAGEEEAKRPESAWNADMLMAKCRHSMASVT